MQMKMKFTFTSNTLQTKNIILCPFIAIIAALQMGALIFVIYAKYKDSVISVVY